MLVLASKTAYILGDMLSWILDLGTDQFQTWLLTSNLMETFHLSISVFKYLIITIKPQFGKHKSVACELFFFRAGIYSNK